MSAFSGEVGEAGQVRTYRQRHTGEGAAGTDFSEVGFAADFAGTITGCRFIPDAAVSGATATASTFSLLNKTQTLVAATLAFITGTDLVAFAAKAIAVSATPANVVVAAGDVFSFAKTHASTGTQMPSGVVEVDVTRQDVA